MPAVPSAFIAAASPVGSGAAGAVWSRTSGSGNASGRSAGGVRRREAVESASIDVGRSGIGCSSKRQKRVSSIVSQLLHLPRAASAKTPFVGVLIRIGGGDAPA
jgi:hypothetical protein